MVQKTYFKALHYPLTWSNIFIDGRGRRGGLVEKGQGPMGEKCCYNEFLFGERENEDKRS